MKIVGLMACRNEDWCLGLTARAALMWLDGLVLLLHRCEDGSTRIAAELNCETEKPVCINVSQTEQWEEMKHRQMMLECAREHQDATHIVYIDADEILTADLLDTQPGASGQRIRALINMLPPNSILQIPWLQLRGSIGQVHVRGVWADHQNADLAFRDDPALYWSSDGRGGYDFHHRKPMGKTLVPWAPLGARRDSGLMHLQMVNGRRLRAKQALYKMTEVLRWPGREPIAMVNERYNLAVYGQYKTPKADDLKRSLDATLTAAPLDRWWKAYSHLMHHLKPHTAPWQEAEVLRLLEEHGPQKFAGLDLFGLGEPAFHERG